MAVPARLSGVVPSPQFTEIPVTVVVLETVKVTVTVCLVVAGLGVGLLTVTVGTAARAVVREPVAWPVEPLLSVAVIVIVNALAVEYVCVSDVAVPARVSTAVPSPQLTVMEETVPSGSVAVKVAVTSCPVFAGFGKTFGTLTTGGRSLIVSIVVPEPGPAVLVAVTLIVKV